MDMYPRGRQKLVGLSTFVLSVQSGICGYMSMMFRLRFDRHAAFSVVITVIVMKFMCTDRFSRQEMGRLFHHIYIAKTYKFSPVMTAARYDTCHRPVFSFFICHGFMRNSIREAIENGMPSVAECGGFMYLHESMTDEEGVCWRKGY